MKKIISLCLSAVMILSLMTISFTPVMAETDTETDTETTTELTPSDDVVVAEDGSWKIENNTLYIYGSGPMEADSSWKDYFFSKAVIQEGITTICNSAFEECVYLAEVEIPYTVTYIGDYAFKGCENLIEVAISDSVTSIGNYAFENCYSLQRATINANISAIPTGLFVYCSALTEVTISQSITAIGSYAFYNTNLSKIDLPENLSVIGEFAFYQNTNLTDLSFPDTVTELKTASFKYCKNLNNLSFPDNLTVIGSCAFYGCESITDVTIPASVSCIGEDAFALCSSLSSISVAEDNPVYDSRNDCNALIMTDSNVLVRGTSNTDIPDSVVALGINCFSRCIDMETITIPTSVTSIGYSAFSYCENLTEVEIPDSVTYIGAFAFQYCLNLTSILIPESVVTMGENIFYEASSSLVIEGYQYSTAYTYALNNYIKFNRLNGISSTEPPEASDDETEASTEAPTEAETETTAPTEEPGPYKVESVSVTNITANTYTVEWEALEEAVKYWVYVDGIIFVSTTDTSVTIKGKTGNEYCVQVVAKLNDGRITKLTRATTVIAQVLTGDTVNLNGVKAVTLNWEENENISKYWVYSYNEATDSYSAIASTKTNSVSLSKLNHTTNYQLKIKTFIDGVLTDISGIEVTYDCVCTSKVIDADSSSLTVTWTPYENAEKYWVFVSSTTDDIKNTSEWTVYSTTENNLKTYMSMEGNTTYNVVVRVKYTLEDGTAKTFDYKEITGSTK